jgi:hypothetical protein
VWPTPAAACQAGLSAGAGPRPGNGVLPGPGIDHCRTLAVAPHPVGRTYYSKSCTKIMLYL